MLTATKQIAEILRTDKADFSRCESPSLRLEKFLDLSEKSKASQVEAAVACANKFAALPPPRQYPGQIQFAATLGGNMVVNHSVGVLENAGLCLHRNFGYPLIPGSAIKGCAVHAAYRQWEESPSPELAAEIIAVFGFPLGDNRISTQIAKHLPKPPQEQSGRVSFLAAEPLRDPIDNTYLISDISTCHHPKYYQGKREEAFDNEEPKPLPFPAVKAGAAFVFTIVPLRRADGDTCACAQKWLLQALTIWGIGAKTAAGYGWFKFSEAESQQILQRKEELQQEQQHKRQQALIQQQLAEEKIASERLAQQQAAAQREARQKLPEDKRLDAELLDKCPDETRFRSRLRLMARGSCSEGEERAIIRALAGKYRDLWQNELKPLLNARYRPQKGQPNWKVIANKIAERDRQLHGKENRQL